MLNYNIYSENGVITPDQPVMVLVHGLGGGYANWVYQVRHLRKKYQLVLIELPSHGRSKHKMSELGCSFDVVSRMIIEVMDHLGIQKASFAGVSLGTMVVKHIVLTYSERVDKYFLIGPVGRYTFLHNMAFCIAIMLLPIAPLNFVISLVCKVLMPYKKLSYARNLFLASAQRVERKEFIAWGKAILSFGKMQKEFGNKMKDEPNGLYIVGELDHFFLTMLRFDMKRIKNVVIVKEGGHVCCIDQYEVVNKLISDFQETGTATA